MKKETLYQVECFVDGCWECVSDGHETIGDAEGAIKYMIQEHTIPGDGSERDDFCIRKMEVAGESEKVSSGVGI